MIINPELKILRMPKSLIMGAWHYQTGLTRFHFFSRYGLGLNIWDKVMKLDCGIFIIRHEYGKDYLDNIHIDSTTDYFYTLIYNDEQSNDL